MIFPQTIVFVRIFFQVCSDDNKCMANDEQMRDGDRLLTLHYAFGLANNETFIIVSQIW